jgi:hypothetical protein
MIHPADLGGRSGEDALKSRSRLALSLQPQAAESAQALVRKILDFGNLCVREGVKGGGQPFRGTYVGVSSYPGWPPPGVVFHEGGEV